MEPSSSPTTTTTTCAPPAPTHRHIRFGCLGNSIQYYNDCPRLLERLFQGWDVKQTSCLRGGATLVTLWERGNGMRTKFSTPTAARSDGSFDIGLATVQALLENDDIFQHDGHDFVILNDHTQSPARNSSRKATLRVLKEHYAPLIRKSQLTPVFLQTAAYRLPGIKGTDDLGDFDQFTRRLQEGCQMYRQKMDQFLNTPDRNTRVAPVGLAYSKLYHSDRALWERLYDPDNFHPSPHGTLLQAYVLYITLTNGEEPPMTYHPSWWDGARVMQPDGMEPLPRPTVEEASTLRSVAIQVCQETLEAQ